MRKAAGGFAVVVATAAIGAGSAAAEEPRLTTPDGGRLVFHTAEALVAADTDSKVDVYLWNGTANELVSDGTSDHAFAEAVSRDGEHVIFGATDALVPADTDTTDDIYERVDGTIRLVSTGPADAGGSSVGLADVSADGDRIIFHSSARLVASDADSSLDIYAREDGATTLLSPSPAGAVVETQRFLTGASSDGTRLFDLTAEPLVSADKDQANDVYELSGGTAKLITTGSLDVSTAGVFPVSGGVSADGSSVVWQTQGQLEPGDANRTWDLYQRRNGRTRVLTANRLGLTESCAVPHPGGPAPDPCEIFDVAQTADGATVAFSTPQRLVSSDRDAAEDVYRRTGSAVERVAQGFNPDMTADGGRMVFGSGAPLAAGDTDSASDLYAREDGATTLLTPGTSSTQGTVLEAASRDLDRVYFGTGEGLVPEDTDGVRFDLYESAGGSVRLVSTGPADDHAPGDLTAVFYGLVASEDGGRVFFTSRKPLVPEDSGTSEDLYTWSDGVTTLVTG